MLASAALLVLAETNEWGRKYLEKNRFRKEFTALQSGLQYRVVEEGSGKRHPTPDSECLCHYEGRTAFQYEPGKRRWQTFDSSAPLLLAVRPTRSLITPRVCIAQATSAASPRPSPPTA